ncbi:MAG TPA: cell shape determination protein CcmA [Bacteroidetes bacterium]|nr:cell shape determination protein CcmA [Bacteroidota bacterium]
MKEIMKKNILLLSMLFVAWAFNSCEKDSDGSPVVEPGTPVFESISPTAAAGGELVVVTGSGLGDMVAIIFETDSVPAYLMPTLNTDKAILFRVPTDAFGGEQDIIFINSIEKTMRVPFNVLAFPQVSSVSTYTFKEGTQITLEGNNLNDVSSVVLTETGEAATIISQERKIMVIEMPATTAVRTTLDITNVTGEITTTQEFISITNSFIVYDDAYGPGAFNGGIQNWGWSCVVSETNKEFKTGTKSLKVEYSEGGGLSLFLGSDTWEDGHWFTDYYTAEYLVFYAKGDGKSAEITIRPDSPPWSDFATGEKTVSIPADEWTFFKIPLSDFVGGSGNFGRINFQITGSGTVYYDDLLFVE